MNEEPFSSQDEKEKGKKEGEKLSLGEAKPLRIEPKEAKLVQKDIPPATGAEKPIEVAPKETMKKKEEKMVISPKLPETRKEMPLKTEGKSSPFFKFLFVLSLVFMAVAVGLLLLPLLNISIPPFLTSAINFVSSK